MQAFDRCLPLARCGAVLVGLLSSMAAVGLAQVSAPVGKLVISDVIIQGNRHIPTEEIRAQIKTRPGDEYVPEVLQEDVRQLFATRKFGNVYADKQDEGNGRVKVFFTIRDYPSVVEKVEYRGAHAIKRDDLDSATNIRKGMPLNPIANKVACQRIVAKYNEEGRPFAACELLKGGDANDTEVIFNVTEGPKVRIGGIEFSGNNFLSSERLRTYINASNGLFRMGVFGTPYNAALIDNDVNELMKVYRSFGFHDVRVGRQLRWSADNQHVTVVYVIQEGVRFTVLNVPDIHGVKSTSVEGLQTQVKVKAGDYYEERKIEADKARIKDWIGNQGRETRVEAIPVYPPDKPGIVQLVYQVEERPPARVGQIFIVGNDRTMQNVILRQLPLYPGQILTYPDLRIAERNLARLGIFDGGPDNSTRPTVTVLDNPLDPDNPYKDLLVTVQEGNTGSLLFGIGVNSDSGLTGSIVLNERNFDLFRPPTSIDDILNGTAWRGAGQEFRLEAVPGTQLQRYTVTLREPFLLDSPFSLTTSGYYYQRYFNEYSEDRIGGRVTLGRKLNDIWSVNAGVRAENVTVYNVPLGAPPTYVNAEGDNLLVGFRAGVMRDTRDSFLRPTEGSLFEASYEEVVGTATYPLVNASYSQFFTTYQRADGSGRHVLAISNQFGWAGTNTPVYERYFGGGFRSIRGFQFRGIGPDVNGFKTGGDFLFVNSVEYQIPVQARDNIYFVGFVDSGTVTERINKIDDYRVSVGFGVRFVVPMMGPVPIALDFGFPIVKGPRDNEQIFNFSMGFTRQ
jgi:outer membrane protein assembly complex protein YaeT